MGYGIVLVMKKTFDGGESYEGRVAYAKKFEQMTKDAGVDMEEISYDENFSEEYDEVQLVFDDDCEVNFYPNLIRVWTPYVWWQFLNYDYDSNSIRKLFQRLIDVIQPEDCWVGADYATDQTCEAEVGYEKWIEDIQEAFGQIRDFDFDSVFENLKQDTWPDVIYHVKDNNLYKSEEAPEL